MDAGASLEACVKAGNEAHWAYEHILSGAAEAEKIFEEGFPGDRLMLGSYQQAQVRLATRGGASELSSAKARELSASIGGRAGTLPGVQADLTGPLGGRMKRGLPMPCNHQQAQ